MPAEDAAAAAVAIKLPPFWAHQPEVWFAQAEAQFELRGITVDNTKYAYLVSALPEDVAVRVLDYIKSMVGSAATTKYQGLRDRLLGTFTLSDYERAGLLIDGPNLGDEKPSALMDKMLALLGDHPPCFLFKRHFLQRLPAEIRAPLLNGGENNMRKLAEQADLIWQARAGMSTSAVAVSDDTEVNKVTKPKGANSTKGSAFQKWKDEWQQVPGGPCAYHSYYGARARTCTAPCSHSSGNASAGRH